MVERFLVSLLLKLGVMASIASILARSNSFKSMLMLENRTLNQRLNLSLWQLRPSRWLLKQMRRSASPGH